LTVALPFAGNYAERNPNAALVDVPRNKTKGKSYEHNKHGWVRSEVRSMNTLMKRMSASGTLRHLITYASQPKSWPTNITRRFKGASRAELWKEPDVTGKNPRPLIGTGGSIPHPIRKRISNELGTLRIELLYNHNCPLKAGSRIAGRRAFSPAVSACGRFRHVHFRLLLLTDC
jgi:hypothetical protein